ncbi:hypothetical protein VHUM_02822 [Vanrija humicola]|uniref:Pyrroloquinoline quinone-dependent pyranose dehydrogenase beta-propeller domain-containing protein n=1 Tax=Vanrija humicola TaxID=5417 RepID=A0A7D8UY40_VANHU|nr:hypothetical protein VHUM_02822 [Vanrija humicola]
MFGLSSISTLPLALILTLAASAAADTCTQNRLHTTYPAPVAADGWSYRVIANGLKKPRSILFDSSGALLVLESGKGVTRLSFNDSGGSCLGVKELTTVVANPALNHGLQILNGSLLASTDNDVFSWRYDAGAGTVDNATQQVLVTNMTNAGHKTRTLLVTSRSQLLVSRGSAGNADPAAVVKSSGHCHIRSFTPSSTPADFASGGETVGWGLRNSVGIAEHPDGGIWSVENSVDNLSRQGTDIHKDNPGEELNYHGSVTSLRGANHGYPLCYALWGTEGFPNRGNLSVGDQFSVEAAEGVNVAPPTDAQCNSEYAAPALAFQAHTAPLDIVFDQDGSNAYISFHGSWNRETPVGYAVSRVAFTNGRPAEVQSSTNAVTDILRNPDLKNCPSRCFRPVGLAWDSAGRLWFSSDSTGEIFVLAHGGDAFADDSGAAAARVSLVAVVGALTAAWLLIGV